RRQVPDGKAPIDFIGDAVTGIAEGVAAKYSPESKSQPDWDLAGLKSELRTTFNMEIDLKELTPSDTTLEAVLEVVREHVVAQYQAKMSRIGDEWQKKIESYIYLQIIDQTWKDHLRSMEQLQDNVRLRGYGQRDPLQEYKKEAFKLFESMM